MGGGTGRVLRSRERDVRERVDKRGGGGRVIEEKGMEGMERECVRVGAGGPWQLGGLAESWGYYP